MKDIRNDRRKGNSGFDIWYYNVYSQASFLVLEKQMKLNESWTYLDEQILDLHPTVCRNLQQSSVQQPNSSSNSPFPRPRHASVGINPPIVVGHFVNSCVQHDHVVCGLIVHAVLLYNAVFDASDMSGMFQGYDLDTQVSPPNVSKPLQNLHCFCTRLTPAGCNDDFGHTLDRYSTLAATYRRDHLWGRLGVTIWMRVLLLIWVH